MAKRSQISLALGVGKAEVTTQSRFRERMGSREVMIGQKTAIREDFWLIGSAQMITAALPFSEQLYRPQSVHAYQQPQPLSPACYRRPDRQGGNRQSAA